jgi:hypothetical protein
MDDREQRVRERAFQIWIEEGQPEGKDREHWERAEKEVAGTPPQAPGGTSVTGLIDGGEGHAPSECRVY